MMRKFDAKLKLWNFKSPNEIFQIEDFTEEDAVITNTYNEKENKHMGNKKKTKIYHRHEKKYIPGFDVIIEPFEVISHPTKESKDKSVIHTPWIRTTVFINGEYASVSCPENFATFRDGVRQACAKIQAQKDSVNKTLYKVGNMPNNPIGDFIIDCLADEACACFNISFNALYKKWQNYQDHNYRCDCTCNICGKLLETPDALERHKKWHIERKIEPHRRYLVNKEARDRKAKEDHEAAVQKAYEKLCNNSKTSN